MGCLTGLLSLLRCPSGMPYWFGKPTTCPSGMPCCFAKPTEMPYWFPSIMPLSNK